MNGYRERLVPGPGTVVAVLLVLPAVFLVMLPIDPGAGVVLAVVLTALIEGSLFLAAPTVTVAGGVLRAGRAHIPVGMTGAATGYRGAAATVARGTGLDARAWTLLRGWVDPVARIDVTDPDDPVPYWLVSTRRPEALIAALEAERG